MSPTICESLRMRPKALQVRACVWDGRVWWTHGIQGHPQGKEKSILNAYVWLHPRRFWSDLATAFSLWLGCSTTTIYILKRVRTPILDFSKNPKSGSSMFSILKSLWLSTQTTTILIRLSDCFFVVGGIKLRSKQTKKITGVGQTNNDDFEGINPPPTTIFWGIHPHPRRFFGESTHTHDDFLGNPPTPTTIFGESTHTHDDFWGIHPHPWQSFREWNYAFMKMVVHFVCWDFWKQLLL